MRNRQITKIELSATHDPGHSGSFYCYNLDLIEDTYDISVIASRIVFSGRGNSFESASTDYRLKVKIEKDTRQIEEFLEKLVDKFDVFELKDLTSRFFLHPTFYTFKFQDSKGAENRFEYMIECMMHLDEKYETLVKTFDEFFEVKRVSSQFYEYIQAQTNPSKARAKKSGWKFW